MYPIIDLSLFGSDFGMQCVKFRSSRIRCGKPTIGREFPWGFRVGFPSPLLVSSATMGVFSRLGQFEASAMAQMTASDGLEKPHQLQDLTSEMFQMNYPDDMCQLMFLLFILTELLVSCLGSRQQQAHLNSFVATLRGSDGNKVKWNACLPH